MEKKMAPNKKKYPKINNIMNLIRTLLFLPLFSVYLVWIILDFYIFSKLSNKLTGVPQNNIFR